VKDPHQPKTWREAMLPVCLLILGIVPGMWALIAGHDEAEPLVADPKGCHAGSQLQHRSCLGLNPKVVLWGDSEAQSWAPLAEAVAGHMRLPATTVARAGCPPLPGADLPLRSPMEAKHCAEWNREALGHLATHGADTVIIAALRPLFFTG